MGIEWTKDTSGMDKLIGEMPGRVNAFLMRAGFIIQADIQSSFGTSPSAPGGPPGIDTGALSNSLQVVSKGPKEVWVQDGVVYGLVHEWGLGNHPPRPWMVPAFERQRGSFAADFADFMGLL